MPSKHDESSWSTATVGSASRDHGLSYLAVEFFVGGLPFSISASDLAAFARPVVQLNAAMVVADRETGRSRGFGRIDVPDFALLDAADDSDDLGLTSAAKQSARERLEQLNGT